MFGQPQPFYPMPGMMQQPFGGVLQGGQMQPQPAAPSPQPQPAGLAQMPPSNFGPVPPMPQFPRNDGGLPMPSPAFQPQGFGGMRPQMSLPPMPGLQQPAPQPGLGMLGNAIMQNAGRNFRQR